MIRKNKIELNNEYALWFFDQSGNGKAKRTAEKMWNTRGSNYAHLRGLVTNRTRSKSEEQLVISNATTTHTHTHTSTAENNNEILKWKTTRLNGRIFPPYERQDTCEMSDSAPFQVVLEYQHRRNHDEPRMHLHSVLGSKANHSLTRSALLLHRWVVTRTNFALIHPRTMTSLC